MVHIVRKVKNGKVYLALQRSVYKNGKRKTEHVKYLGRQERYTKEQLAMIVKEETYRQELKEVGIDEDS